MIDKDPQTKLDMPKLAIYGTVAMAILALNSVVAENLYTMGVPLECGYPVAVAIAALGAGLATRKDSSTDRLLHNAHNKKSRPLRKALETAFHGVINFPLSSKDFPGKKRVIGNALFWTASLRLDPAGYIGDTLRTQNQSPTAFVEAYPYDAHIQPTLTPDPKETPVDLGLFTVQPFPPWYDTKTTTNP